MIQIGPIEIRYGKTTKTIKPGGNVHYASELKEFGLSANVEDTAGRTMLGFDTGDEEKVTAPTLKSEAPVARAVTADGEVEIGGPDTMDMELMAAGGELPVRDLDLALAEDMPPASEMGNSLEWAKTERAAPAAAGTPVEPAAPLDSAKAEPSSGADASETAVKLVLEVRGPAAEVEAFLQAIRDKRIQVPPLSLLIRDL